MSCEDYRERIALLAGGELPDAERAEVERHLAECEECHELAAELGEVRELLGALAQESASEAVLAEVRSGVSEQIARSARRWRWVAVAAAAVVLMGVGIEWRTGWRSEPGLPSPAPVVVETPEAPTIAEMMPAPSVPVVVEEESPMPPPEAAPVEVPVQNVAPAARVEETATVSARTQEPLVVKFLTDDPDIVIYWIAEGSGG